MMEDKKENDPHPSPPPEGGGDFLVPPLPSGRGKGRGLEPKITPEIGGPKGLEPTRYGDWEKNGKCVDF